MSTINPWKPEPDLMTHQVIGKAAEEASELAGILARILIQGLDERDPGTGRLNRDALVDEMSDVTAAIQWIEYQLGIKPYPARVDRKLAGFKLWGEMIANPDATIVMIERETCPSCGRLKAQNADDMARGDCPKWYAVNDQMAEDDCKSTTQHNRFMGGTGDEVWD